MVLPASPPDNILVIKLGALGDFILAFSAFAAIRAHHPHARITLLTTAPFAGMGEASPWFDAVWVDSKPRWTQPLAVRDLARRLRSGHFTRVYDLQTSDRSGFYFRLFGHERPEWSGIARGCSHPDPTPDRAAVHSWDLRANQLKAAGIADVKMDAPDWLGADISRFALPPRCVLLVPGSAPHRPDKRWPVTHYTALAARLAAKGHSPVVLGTAAEADLGRQIATAAPTVRDLTGQTTLWELASLGRYAAAAVGNDTGPIHLLAAVGCPTTVLFSAASNPVHSSPRGRAVTILQRPHLADLALADVEAALALP